MIHRQSKANSLTLVDGGVDGATGCPEVFGVMPLKKAKTHVRFDGQTVAATQHQIVAPSTFEMRSANLDC
jgi:hypothetical protein